MHQMKLTTILIMCIYLPYLVIFSSSVRKVRETKRLKTQLVVVASAFPVLLAQVG